MDIFYYNLEIYKKPSKRFNDDKFTNEVKILLAENEKYIVFNDHFFTKIEKRGDGFLYSTLNKPSIRFKNIFDEGIFYTLYSTKRIRTSTIESQIKKEAKAKFGYLFDEDFDFSILKGQNHE